MKSLIRNRQFILLAILLGSCSESLPPEEPRYESYTALPFSGTPAADVDLSSELAQQFSQYLLEAFAEGATFAGQYAMAVWSCGTSCQTSAVIDMASGSVTFGPVAELGFAYTSDSRLLIANPPDEVALTVEAMGGCEDAEEWMATSRYFEWTGTEFILITSSNVCE